MKRIVMALACALVATPAAGQKISALPAASTPAASDQAAVIQGSGCTTQVQPCTNARMSLSQVAGYVATDPAITGVYQPIISSSNASAVRNTLGVTATGADATYAFRGNNLSDLASAPTARSNLGLAIGTNVQAWDADLDAIAALTGTSTLYYRSGAGAWSPVTFGPNLSFTGGALTIPGLPITVTGDATGSTSATSGALALTLATVPTTKGGTGRTTAMPIFSAYSYGTSTIVQINGGFTTIIPTTVVTDSASAYSTSTGIYTVPEAGTYFIAEKYRLADGTAAGINYGIGADTVNQDSAFFFWSITPAISGTTREGIANFRIYVAAAGAQLRMFGYSSNLVNVIAAELNIYRIR